MKSGKGIISNGVISLYKCSKAVEQQVIIKLNRSTNMLNVGQQPRWFLRGMIVFITFIMFIVVSNQSTVFASDPWIDTNDRQAVIDFYWNEYQAYAGTPIGWTGNYANCDAGDTSQAHKDATLKSINYYRSMAGVPPITGFVDEYNQKAKAAAIMMSVNNALSHEPPTTWDCYTTAGYEGASNSNLARGSHGWSAIRGYMVDGGENNVPVGHRRWLLYPPTEQMGTGDIARGTDSSAANALWVFGATQSSSAIETRDEFVAWPPSGYVPYQVVPERWSFALSDSNVDFSQATLHVIKNNQSVHYPTIISRNGDYGDKTLVWEMPTDIINHGEPPNDIPSPGRQYRYQVAVGNIGTNCSPTCEYGKFYVYQVSVMDPIAQGDYFVDEFVDGSLMTQSKNGQFPATSLTHRQYSGSFEQSEYMISNHANGTIVSDPISVDVNKSYLASFDARGEIAADATYLGMSAEVQYYRDADGNSRILTLDPEYVQITDPFERGVQSMSWKTYSAEVVPHPDAVSARIVLKGSQFSGWVTFDNVSFRDASANNTPNLVTNPGFENNTGWTVNKDSNYPATTILRHNRAWQTGAGRTGYGYAITNQAYGSLMSNWIEIDPNNSYEMTFSVRGEMAADASRGTMSARVFYYDEQGAARLTHYDRLHQNIQSNSWQTLKLAMNPPADATYARVQLIGYQFSGWVAFDNVSLHEVGTTNNLVANPGFENRSGWTASKNGQYPATAMFRHNRTWQTGSGQNGYGYAITNQAYGNLLSQPIELEESDQYEYEAFVRMRGGIATDASKGTISFRVFYYDDPDATRLTHYDRIHKNIESGSWNTFRLEMNPPANARYVRIQLVTYQFSGWSLFDEIEIRRYGPDKSDPPPPGVST